MPSLASLKWIAIALCVVVAFGAGWDLGGDRVQAKWDAEKAELNAKAAEAIQTAMNRTLAAEREAAAKVAATSAKYQMKLQEKQSEEVAAIEHARAGGLYINAQCPSGGNSVSQTGSGSSGRNGEARVKLPDETAESLLRLAAEADRVAEQLNACQNILEEERK
jgi:hypothetical protein